ncbi:MAG TPA: HEAT repeat domain-containing protein [Planktothrix sp.]
MFPHEHIQETEDRSWTFRLIDALASCESGDFAEIKKSLIHLSDPRSIEPLTSLLLNRDNPAAIRQAAGDVLCSQITPESSEERLQWWHAGDPILKHYAVLSFERTELDLIEKLLAEPESVYFADAIKTIETTQSEEIRYQRILIDALKHRDAAVRLNAASALLWHEPAAAEEALIEVGISDTDVDVAEEALDTLAYYRSRNLLTRMNELRKTGRAELKDAYQNTFKWVNDEFVRRVSLDGRSAELFAAWVSPVQDILEYPEKDDCDKAMTQFEQSPPKKCIPTADQILREFGDPDGEWLAKKNSFYSFDWEGVNEGDRDVIAKFLCSHPDEDVRQFATDPCGIWLDAARLLALSHDPALCVRKSASYMMRKLPPSQDIADRLWQLFTDPCTTYVFCYESLESYVVHEMRQEVNDVLLSVALNDQRPIAVKYAIYQLRDREASNHIKEVIPLLRSPAFNSWAVHVAILDSCLRLKIDTGDIGHLAEVDNLDLQLAVCEALGQ